MPAARLIVKANGSLRVEGDFEIVDEQGRPYGLPGRTHASICRCGASKNLPFCDGAHKNCGFVSPSEARDLPPPAPKA